MSPRAATTSIFFLNGAVVGTWIAHIPHMQDRLDVSTGTIGLVLLCMALGALSSMPVAGQVLDRRPSATVVRVASLVYCLLAPLPLLATTPLMLAGLLFVFGAANGVMDVSMNAHGVAVERDCGRPIMSSLHAGWSFGGFAAAGCAALAAGAGLDARLEALAVGVVLWLVAFFVTTRLGRATAQSQGGGGFALPSRGVLLLGILCFLAMTTEGAMSDWSGIYLRRDLGAGAAAATTGFVGFSLGMALARVTGDRVNARLGPSAVLRGGTLVVAVTLGTLLVVAEPVVAVIGFTLIGLGIANAVPIMFSAAGRVPPSGPSLAAVFSVGYFGFIIGPPFIGFLANALGLPGAFTVVCVATLTVTLLGGRALGAGDRAAEAAGGASAARSPA